MSDKKLTVVPIHGEKKTNGTFEGAILHIDQDTIFLDSFVLSGVDENGRRCVLTWNCSLDELASYTVVLDTVIRDKVRDAIHDERI